MIKSAVLVTRISKSGKEYICLEVTFKNGYKKTVFLDTSEQFMLQSLQDERS